MGTSTVALLTGTDDGDYSATTLATGNKIESFTNGYQFFRFSGLNVPSYRRCVIDSASLALAGSSGLLSLATETASFTAQPGASAAIGSGADATARPRTFASASANLNQVLLGGVATIGITGVVAEAVGRPSWTSGSALTIFGQRVSLTGLGSPFSWWAADNGSGTPVLTVVWHPSGDVQATAALTGARSARPARRGSRTGTAAVAGARAGRKTRQFAANGGAVTVTGTRGAVARKRGTTLGAVAGASGRAGRAGRRNALAASVQAAGAVSGRPARRAMLAGFITGAGARAGAARRRGGTSGTGGAVSAAAAAVARAGRPAPGFPHLAGAPRGAQARSGALRGTGIVSGQRSGAGARTGGVTGAAATPAATLGNAANRAGFPAGQFTISAWPSGAAGHAAGVSGGTRVTATTRAITGRCGALTCPLVLAGHAGATARRGGQAGGQARLHGRAVSADQRASWVQGRASVTGTCQGTALRAGRGTPGAAHSSGTTSGSGIRHGGLVPVAAGARGTPTGHAVHAGTARGQTQAAGTRTALPHRAGTLRGAARVEAGARTGRAQRDGACVAPAGARCRPAGLNGYPAKAETGRGLLTGRAASSGRAGHALTLSGTVAVTGPVQATTGRRGPRAGAATTLTGRSAARRAARSGTAGNLPGSGQVTGSRLDAVAVHATARLGGVARGHRATGGQVTSSPLREVESLAAATTRSGASRGEATAVAGRGSARRGGQGAPAGEASIHFLIGVPVDFNGGSSGAATLRGRTGGKRTIPLEVAHVVVRAPVTVPVYLAPAVRAGTVASSAPYRAPVPITAKPRVSTAVTTTTKQPTKVVRGNG
jgi:hypothetical protein